MRMGIDIGSCYIKAVALDSSGRMVDHHFAPHNGQPLDVIRRFRQQFQQDVTAAGVTGSLSSLLSQDGNHRIARARRKRTDTIRAVVVEVDASTLTPSASCTRLGFRLQRQR